MKKPQVLVMIDWYKPFFKAGGPVRSMVNLVEHLHERIDFHIVTGDRDYMEDRASEDLRRNGWTTGDRGEKIWYSSPQARSIRNWMGLLASAEWDVIYINGLYSKWSSVIPLWLLKNSRVRRIVAIRGMLAKGPMQQRALKKRIFIAIMKAIGAFNSVEFQATNQEEVKEIRKWIGKNAVIHLVPNLPRNIPNDRPALIEKKAGSLTLISPARIAEEKGTLFAIERLKGLKGKVRFDLYGTVYDQGYWELCKVAISELPSHVKVILHGQLNNEEVMPKVSQAHALFMPSTGENFGHAMLESLSVGTPLLISDRTPWRNLNENNAGWDLALEDPNRFQEVLQHLIGMDDREYQELRNGAFALGRRYLTDKGAVEKCLAMFTK